MIKVLIIEDEPLIAEMYQKALDPKEFEVTLAVSGGEKGIGLAKTTNPDIILLDLMMPKPDGIEVLESLKADPSTKGIPVVVLTNVSGKYDTELSLQKGAVDYWIKNKIEVDELGKKIREILKI